MSDDIVDWDKARFKLASGQKVVRVKVGNAEAVQDGRVKTTVDARGLAQLNVRVPVELKNRIVEEKQKHGREMGDVVVEALKAYFECQNDAA